MQRFCRAVGKHEEKHVLTLSTLMTIVMVLLLFLSLTLMLVSVARADIVNRTFTTDGGVVTYEGKLRNKTAADGYDTEPNKILVFEGEKIYFENRTTGPEDIIVTGPYDSDGDTKSGNKDYPRVEAGTPWDCSEDNYYFKVTEADNRSIGGWFGADDHSFSLELEKKGVRESENFKLTMKKNNKMGGVMKLSIEDEDEFLITNLNGTYINKIPIRYDNETDFIGYNEHEPVGIGFENGTLVFVTTELNMKEGEYTIILEDFATEVKKDVDIKVKKIFLEVGFEDEVMKGDDIVIKITSSFYEENVNVTVGDFYNKTFLPLDEDGKIKVTIPTENVDFGTYKVTVEVCGTTEKVIKYVKIKKSGTSLTVPEDATVGDIVHIKGTAASGDFAVLLVDDVFKNKARISDEKFAWDWDTGGELAEYREIEVFIVNESELSSTSVGETVGDAWQREHGVDASATIFLFLPTFSMAVPKNIAKGDDVVTSGTAIGTAHVYIIVISYKGEVVFPPDGTAGAINARTTSVEDGKWVENIGELDSGRYTVIAFYEGKDGVTDAIKGGNWEAGDEGKTLEQRVAILEDKLSSAGSDDQFGKADFCISAPKVILKEPKTVVEIGDEIAVKAETNIREDEKAFISLFQNTSSNILKRTFALVENGSVNAGINTSGLLPGIYTVAVDISGRASAEKEIVLVEKKEVEEVGKEEIAQNESLAEPGTVEKANESMGVGEGEISKSYEEEEEERKIPVSVGDLLIAVVVVIFISFAVRRWRG